jgi:hypothetical protein
MAGKFHSAALKGRQSFKKKKMSALHRQNLCWDFSKTSQK